MENHELSPDDLNLVRTLQDDLAPRLSDQIAQFYQEIKRTASRERARIAGAMTMQTTDLVNELYLKFARSQVGPAASLEHFMALCAVAIRNLLVDRVRRGELAQKYQAEQKRLLEPSLDNASALSQRDGSMDIDVLLVDEALTRLARINPRLARVVECRWFAGYSEPETAQVLGIAERTVRRDWQKAQIWLSAALE